MQKKNILPIISLCMAQFNSNWINQQLNFSDPELQAWAASWLGKSIASSDEGLGDTLPQYNPEYAQTLEVKRKNRRQKRQESDIALKLYKSIKEKESFISASIRSLEKFASHFQGASSKSSSSNQEQLVGGNIETNLQTDPELSNSGSKERPSYKDISQKEAEQIKIRENLYDEMKNHFGNHFCEKLKNAIEPLGLEELVDLYEEEKNVAALSGFDTDFKSIFGESFSLVEFVKANASDLYNPDLSAIVEVDLLNPFNKEIFQCLNKIILSKLNVVSLRLANIMWKELKAKEDFIKRAFWAIYKEGIELDSDSNFLIDGKNITSNLKKYGPWIKRTLQTGPRTRKDGQNRRQAFQRRNILIIKENLKINNSELITSVEEFIDEFNQLLKERGEYGERKYIILSASTNEIIGNMLDKYIDSDIRSEAKDKLTKLLEENEQLFNGFFTGDHSQNGQVKEIIAKLNKYIPDADPKDYIFDREKDQRSIAAKFSLIAERLYSNRQIAII